MSEIGPFAVSAVIFGTLLFYGVGAFGVVHLYVSPSGSDTNDGASETKAFRTIHKAVSLLHGPHYIGQSVFVELLPGYHDLTSTLHITKPVTAQLTIRSLHGKEVHVTGGKRIPGNKFKPVNDQAVLSRLPDAARQHVKVLHLPDVGVTHYPELTSYGAYTDRVAPIEVFFNGEPLRLARWPNLEYINIGKLLDGENGTRFEFNTSVNRPAAWAHESDIWAYGYWYNSWADRGVKVKNLDPRNHAVTLTHNPPFGLRTGHWLGYGLSKQSGGHEQGGYFRFLNVFSELDEPGEYFLDRSSGNLYAWIPSVDGNVSSTDVIYLSLIQECIDIQKGTANVVLRDFTLEACRGMGVHASDVRNLQILDMEVRNTGGYNVKITGDSRHCIVARSLFTGGAGAVSMTGGARVSLDPSGNVAEDNEIFEYAREAAVGHHAVSVSGVGNVVRYNHIHGGQYVGILFHGNDNVMEHNHVHHVCVNASDCGALFTGRDWTSRGNVIRFNIVHNTLRLVPGADVRGVMLDDQVSGTSITNNVFFKNDVHVNIGGGRDNVVSDNVMYDDVTSVMQVDGRGYGHNYDQYLIPRLHEMPFNSTLWTTRYPALASFESKSPEEPRGNQLDRNLVYIRPHTLFIRGLEGRLLRDDFFNVTNLGYARGPGDFVDVGLEDFRPRCLAATWAHRTGFPTPPTLEDVGPRYAIGPQYKRKPHQSVSLATPSAACTTNAPAVSAPMPAYLPDGSRTNDLVKVPNHGCHLKVTHCTAHPSASDGGVHEDVYGEAHEHAGDSEAACLSRAMKQWQYCGSRSSDTVTAVFGPTGAMTVAGDGCFMAEYGCPRHGGPADGHVTQGRMFRDTYAEQHKGAAHNESACLARAKVQWVWCGSDPNHPVTSLYRPTGAIRTAGAGCWVHFEKCPNSPGLSTMHYDAWGATNKFSDISENVCFGRAKDYWESCGSNPAYPVTAFFRPHASSRTYPET